MAEKPNQFEKKEFILSAKDAARVCDALEFAASWDKTEIYYKLKFWIEGKENG